METLEKEFTDFVRQHKSTVFTVCYLFSKNQDEANDLFQEVLINLWRGFSDFRGESSVRTWVYRVSLNTCISLDRKHRRHETVPLTMDINLFEDKDEDTRQINLLYQRINRLGAFDKALVLLWLENMSYDEIAAIVGISTKNVSVRLVRIREELKKMSDH